MAVIDLKNPAMEYRPIPFWSWNDKLEIPELCRQIREMKKAGLGGFFMHARSGLQTPYLSKEWMDCVSACLAEAHKLNMHAWLYDENGWPSGFGGGIVNGMGEKYQQKYLRYEFGEANLLKTEHTIGYYTPDGSRFLGRTVPSSFTGKLLRCYYEVNPYYVDNLDAEVVKEFIVSTHERYYAALPKELRPYLKGIFTDEPQLSRNGLLWSFVLEEEYLSAYGRNLIEELPALFLPVKGCEAMRVRFWKLVGKLFRDHFIRQIREWCDAHGWFLTGHHVLEETLQWQVISSGSLMAQYPYYSIPGVDHLCRELPWETMMTQVISAAAQVGQKQILSESFGCTGWNCNFIGQRWLYQPQLAHGINLLCQHLSGYTLRGSRKRDYPCGFFYHQPWWKDYARNNDYFSRIGEVLANGRQNVQVLVLHPLSSAWCLYRGPESIDEIVPYTLSLKKLSETLDACLINHHYADEILFDDMGSLENDGIRIGKCLYKFVIIPPMRSISGKLADILQKFTGQGGMVLRIRKQNEGESLLIDGEEPDPVFRKWYESLTVCEDEDAAAHIVAGHLPDCPKVYEDGEQSRQLVGTQRYYEDFNGESGVFYYFATLKEKENSNLHFVLPAKGQQLEVVDSVNGERRVLTQTSYKDGCVQFDYPLAGAEAVLFFIPDHASGNTLTATNRRELFSGKNVKTISNVMDLISSDENLLTLDSCKYRIDDETEWKDSPVISLQATLAALKRPLKLFMRFSFFIRNDFDFSNPVTLIAETPDKYTFSLNGTSFQAVDTGYLFDSAFRRILLPSFLRKGWNILEVSMEYHQSDEIYNKIERAKKFETEFNTLAFDTEIESFYLAGNFGVFHVGEVETLSRGAKRFNGDFQLGALPQKKIDVSGLLNAGFLFFAGSASFRCSVELTEDDVKQIDVLQFAPYGANSWKVQINGVAAGECYQGPYAVHVSGLLQPGKNNIVFEMTTSLRNMLGPHHLASGEGYCISPMAFLREKDCVGHNAPKTVDGFCLIEHGIGEIHLIKGERS